VGINVSFTQRCALGAIAHILTLQRFVSQMPSLIDRPEWYNVVRQRVAVR
jgi:hypothetical protein